MAAHGGAAAAGQPHPGGGVMEQDTRLGEVITFYSYKGGTGRSMALANVGCVLAQSSRERDVLMIDWDLEAPGLHHFLPLAHGESKGGVLELFTAIDARADQVRTREDALQLLDDVGFETYVQPTAVPGLQLLPAGRFDATYGARVNAFSWENLFNKAPALLPAFAEFLAGRHAFVLVDSRTGITDVSGLCTTVLPSKLVVVFTPNKQSLTGIFELIRRSTKYRRESNDWRPLSVFPLPSRIEPAREQLMNEWRFGNEAREGYQRQFESLFREVYALDECDLTDYLNEVQIQHVADYAYGEQVAVLVETATRLSLKRSYEEFATRLRTVENAWQDVAAVRAEQEIATRLREVEGAVKKGAYLDAWSMLRGVIATYRDKKKLSVPDLPDLLGRTAASLLEQGKTKEALELAEAAVDAERRESGEGEPETIARELQLAQTYLTSGLHREALGAAERVLELAPTAIEAVRLIADVRSRLGDVDGSLAVYRRAVDMAAERFGAESEEVTSLLLQVVPLYINARRYEEAEDVLARVRAIYEAAGNVKRIPEVLHNSAQVRMAVGDYDAARAMLEKALQVQKEIGANATEVTETIEQLALVAERRDDLPEARRLLEDAYFRRSTSRDRSDPALIHTLGQIGRIAAKMGQNDVARERLHAALSIAESSLPPQHVLHSSLRRNLSAVFIAERDFGAADEVAREALKYARAAGNVAEQIGTLYLLAHLADEQGGDAEPLLEEGLALTRQIADVPREAIFAHALGRHFAQQGQVANARERMMEARELYARLGISERLERVEADLAALDPPSA